MSASPISLLVQAEEQALAADERLDSLLLDPLARGLPDIPVAERIVQATSTLTIDGASSLTLGIHDPDWLIESSGILTNEHGRLATIDLRLDGLVYRLVQASRRDPDTLTLTFEDLLVALLREHTDPMTASRGSMTRAQFIERMVREVDPITIPFYSPDKGVTQRIARPDFPGAAPSHGDNGFDKNVRLELTDEFGNPHTLDVAQMTNAATALTVADQEGASEKPTVALLEAGIVEAPFFSNPVGGDGSSVGMLQLLAGHLGGSTSTHGGRRDVALVCRLFLTEGFTGRGGAIKLAREHPDWSAGRVAQEVQGSAFPGRYDAVRGSAQKVLAAWNKGAGHNAAGDTVLTAKQFQFTRGLAGKRESSWDAARRLAEDVNWRFYVEGGVAVFINDDRLMLTPASAAIGFDAPVLIDRPRYDLDHGKPLQTCELQVTANLWALPAGDILALNDRRFGSAFGRWIVETVEQNLLDATDTTVTLIKPLPPRLEPATEIVQVAAGAGKNASAVEQVRAAAAQISRLNLPYVWGGGHAKAGTPDKGQGAGEIGYDCSGYTAACLDAGGVLPDAWKTGVPASGTFASSWGEPGEGQHMTVWANADHVWIEFRETTSSGYARADTSPHLDGPNGPHLRHKKRGTAGFTPRHHTGT